MLEAITRTHLRRVGRRMRDFWRHPDGATAIEYALIAAAVAVSIIAAIFAVGNTMQNMFNDIGNNINNAGG